MRIVSWLIPMAALAAPAHADNFLTAEVPAAAAVSGPQEQAFRAGAMPALGAYLGDGAFAFGVRLRAGILRDGRAPGNGMADPGTGGLATGGVAARFGIAGGWAELVAGGGVTGRDVVPAFEAGVGWSFAVGKVDVGPSLRYLRLEASGSDALGSADLVLVGVDVQLGHHRRQPLVVATAPVMPPPAPAPVAAPPPAPPPDVEDDGDDVTDGDMACSDLLAAGDDSSGCPPAPSEIKVEGDRIILDDRILFETDRAHVRSAGREAIARIVEAWRQHPDWTSMIVEGYADVRGPDDYNLQLSQLRAERVRAQLLKDGIDPDKVSSVGYGREHPRDPGTSPEALQRNRRVEFVIVRGGAQ